MKILRYLGCLLILTSHCYGGNDLEDIFEEKQVCGNAKVDMVLVIDSSGSVQSVFELYRDAALDLVRMLPIGPDRTLLSVIQYNGLTFLKMEFTDEQDLRIVNKTVGGLEWLGGTTQSAEAVDLGISSYRKGREDASKMFVLMTDGNSYNTWERVMETAERLHNTGARIYIVALGDTMYEPELEAYAGPNGTVFKRADFNRFKGEILDLTGFVCHTVDRPVIHVNKNATILEPTTPVPDPYPGQTASSGAGQYPGAPSGSSAEVTQAGAGSYSVAPPAGGAPATAAPPAAAASPSPQSSTSASRPGSSLPPPQGCAADILFILDSSGSVRDDFDRQISFILEVIASLNIDLSAHLVAIVEYAGEMRQRLQFSFTAYSKKDALVSAIKALPFFSGTTATGEALKLGKHALGDRRSSVPALVFVLTDGFSQDDVTGPAAELREESNAEVYAVGVTKSVNPKELLNIAGDSKHVFNEGSVSKILTDVLPKYLTCGQALPTAGGQATDLPTSPSLTGSSVPSAGSSATQPPATQPGGSSATPSTGITGESPASPNAATSVNPPQPTAAETQAPPTSPPASYSYPPTVVPPPASPAPVASTPGAQSYPSPEPQSSVPPESSSTPAGATVVPEVYPEPSTIEPTKPEEPSSAAPPSTIAPTAAPTSAAASSLPPLPQTSAPPVPPPTSAPPVPTTAPSTIPPTTEPVATGCLLDLFFVLDSSGSVAQTFQKELEFASSIVDRLVIGSRNARIGAVKYAGPGKGRVIFPFDKFSNAADVKAAISSSTFISGTTATNEALELAAQEYDTAKGARPSEAKYIVVVFTDGFSQDDPSRGAKALQAKGAKIYAIGVNGAHPVNKAELLEIAGDESRVYTDETIGSLYSALDHLEKACKDATGSEEDNGKLPASPPPGPSSVAQGGGQLSLAPPGPPTSPPDGQPPRRYPLRK